MSRTPLVLPLFVAGLCLLSLPRPAAAQATERTIFVSVLDADGKPVTGLGQDAFTVREDGRAREVLRVSRATGPIDVAVLVDNSQAITAHLTDIRQAISAFVARLAKDGDNVALIGLADRPTILQDYVSSAPLLEKAATRIFPQPGSGTTLLDAIVETARGLRPRDAARRAIVVVTTEGTDFSNTHYQRALEAIRDSSASFQALVLTEPGGSAAAMNTEEGRNRGIVLSQGSESSGGRLQHLISSMALRETLDRLAATFEEQYQVVYSRPGALVPPRTVDVAVNRPGAKAYGTAAPEPAKPGAGE